MRIGTVSLVGAGPGDPELLTLKAIRLLARAEVVVHDRLVSAAVLELTPPTALIVPVGKAPGRHAIPQEEINALLVDLARRYQWIVRLKGGDPFVFGRGGEEAAALRTAGVPCEVVPGITAAQGAAAVARVPLTHRDCATGVRFVTGHGRRNEPLLLDWRGLADPETTLVVYMGAASIAGIAARLIIEGAPSDMPVLAVSSATLPEERRLVSTLSRIGAESVAAGLSGPVLFILGEVVRLSAERPAATGPSLLDLATLPAVGHA